MKALPIGLSKEAKRKSVMKFKVLPVLAAYLAAGVLGGCSQIPDSVNPVEWWKETREVISPTKTAEQRAAESAAKEAGIPGSGKPFPNLASVPERPKPVKRAEYDRAAGELRQDWGIAHAQNHYIRMQEANLGSPARKSPPPLVAPVTVTAPLLIEPPPKVVVPARTVRSSRPKPAVRLKPPPQAAPAPPIVVDPGAVPPLPSLAPVPDVPPPPAPMFPDQRSGLTLPMASAVYMAASWASPVSAGLRPIANGLRPVPKRLYSRVAVDDRRGLLWLAGGPPKSSRKRTRRLPHVPKSSRPVPPRPGTAKFGEPPKDIAPFVEGKAKAKPPPKKTKIAKVAPPPTWRPKRAPEPTPQLPPSAAPKPVPKAPKETVIAKVDRKRVESAPTQKPSQIPVPLEREKNVKGRIGVFLFDFGSASLNTEARKVLKDVIAKHGQVGGKLRIVGHASGRTGKKDPVAHRMANFSMSLDRANAVAQALIKQGVSPELVSVTAMADSQPAYSEQNTAGMARNQRTEIYIDPIDR